MKKYLPVFLLLLPVVIYLGFGNNQKTLDSIVNKPDFTIEVKTIGCFGNTYETFDFHRVRGGYQLTSEDQLQASFIADTTMISFRAYLSKRIIEKEKFGICSNVRNVRIRTFFSSVTYQDHSCDDTLFMLMGLKDLKNKNLPLPNRNG